MKRSLSLLILAVSATTAVSAPLLPAPEEHRLENGMRVLFVPRNDVPLVTYSLEIKGGAAEDPAGKEGLAGLLSTLLGKGAGDRDAAAFQEAVDFVGGTFAAGVAHDHLALEAEFRSQDTDLALELLSDALRRPTLDAGELSKAQGLAIDGIKARRDRPASVIADYWLSWLFQGHPYARATTGDEVSLASITHSHVLAAAGSTLGPARTTLLVAGSFVPQAMLQAIRRRFQSWDAATQAPPTRPAIAAPTGDRVLLVDKPDALQTYFRFGGTGVSWTHEAYPARMIANTILGGRFTSRLNTALRIESGLSYGAHSRFDDSHAGAFSVRSYTATKTSAEALALAAKVYREFREQGITQAELDSARTYIQGQYAPDNVETADQVGGMLLELERAGLGRERINDLFAALDSLRLEQTNQAIRAIFPSQGLTWVVVGQAEKLRTIVAKYGTVTETKVAGPGFAPTN